jgi:predicted RNA-binding Zn ribbon-like protein
MDLDPATVAFPLLGEPLPVELANTRFARRGVLVDGLTTRGDLLAWLVSHREDFPAAIDLDAAGQCLELEDVGALRDLLRELFAAVVAGTRPADAAIAALNRLARQAPAAPQLDWPPEPGRQSSVSLHPTGDDPAAAVLAELARATIRLLGGPDRERLRICQAPGCVLFYVKQHPRREWCSPACGNRARAARHYYRHR